MLFFLQKKKKKIVVFFFSFFFNKTRVWTPKTKLLFHETIESNQLISNTLLSHLLFLNPTQNPIILKRITWNRNTQLMAQLFHHRITRSSNDHTRFLIKSSWLERDNHHFLSGHLRKIRSGSDFQTRPQTD